MPSTVYILALLFLWSRLHLISIVQKRKKKLKLNKVKALSQGHVDSMRLGWGGGGTHTGSKALVPNPTFPQITASPITSTIFTCTFPLLCIINSLFKKHIIFTEKQFIFLNQATSDVESWKEHHSHSYHHNKKTDQII